MLGHETSMAGQNIRREMLSHLQTGHDLLEQRQPAQPRQVSEVQAVRHRPAVGAAVERQLLPRQAFTVSESAPAVTTHVASDVTASEVMGGPLERVASMCHDIRSPCAAYTAKALACLQDTS